MQSARRGFGRPAAVLVVAIAAVLIAAIVYFARTRLSDSPDAPVTHRLTSEVSISGQIKPGDVAALARAGFRTIISVRPEGEAPDQPSYPEMQRATVAAGLGFSYAPVKQGAIGRVPVKALGSSLEMLPKPALIYSASGRRAARVWALVEASRPGGLDAAGIEAALDGAGQASPDLAAEIRSRIAARPTPH